MLKMKKCKIDLEEVSQRIDKVVCTQFDLSRSLVKELIDSGNVLVNNEIVKSSYKVKLDDEVSVVIPEVKPYEIEPIDLNLDIIYEDSDLLIVNKPKEMVVHPAAGHYSGTLVNAIMFHCKDSLSGINGVMRPGIVHRIDMNTTGSIVVCKNDYSHQYIADLLKEHTIARNYRAIVHGVIKEDSGVVEGPIGRDERDRKKMSINHRNGKEAITHFKVIERFENFTYIECQLETGRTHQIRVHMASLGHPLLGDITYTNRKSKFNLTGQTLHAYTIGFPHPRSGEYMEFKAPLPEYFNKLLNIL